MAVNDEIQTFIRRKKDEKSVIFGISSGRIHVLRMTCFLVPAILFYYYRYRDYFY